MVMAVPEELEEMGESEMRRRCVNIIVRLPYVKEFLEWGARLDNARTEEELLSVAEGLIRLVETYRSAQQRDIMLRAPLQWEAQP